MAGIEFLRIAENAESMAAENRTVAPARLDRIVGVKKLMSLGYARFGQRLLLQ
ncbi:hypothetical protein [Nocardia sp. BMG51109]|uniref:hypothetical protein n=1 Tax=Nocardia sp. BMG51109 TaxID=1056816 RepID=UPI001E3151B7|nr:hypothetical protein [Nocardia sp. BMG51109]